MFGEQIKENKIANKRNCSIVRKTVESLLQVDRSLPEGGAGWRHQVLAVQALWSRPWCSQGEPGLVQGNGISSAQWGGESVLTAAQPGKSINLKCF